MSDEPQDVEYGLVMPFVACNSKGGPYDDEAYVAGYEAGLLDEALRVMGLFNSTGFSRTIHAENQPQIDLLAMRHGWVASFADAGDGWLEASFEPAGIVQ